MVSIDKTDGIQVYLSEKSRDAEIVTAKSSEMNISVPSADGDFVSVCNFCNMVVVTIINILNSLSV